jgi:hypothetical protein
MLSFLLLTTIALADHDPEPVADLSYVYQPSFCMDYELRCPAQPYIPHPGDIFLATDRGFLAKLGHKVVHAGAPHHSGIVFCWPDGRPALLEGGPHNSLRCQALDLVPALASYACEERVWIRRRCVPLTPEQSAQLTAFAMAADGKRFATLRMLGQLTFLRSRGPIRSRWLGLPHGERSSYFCSELVMEACVCVGLVDPDTARPSSTYPRDLFFGRSINPYLDCHLDMSAWAPPARWTLCPGAAPACHHARPWLDGDSRPNAGGN